MVKNIGFLVFDEIEPLDLFGPVSVFSCANSHSPAPVYNTILISASNQHFTTETGITISSDFTLPNVPKLDTLIIPGGKGARADKVGPKALEWIRANEPFINRVCSVCTGAYILAATSLLNGRQTTTHWDYAKDLKRLYPAIEMNEDSIFMRDEKYLTSAGITAGIDMSLALVEDDLGTKVASEVAKFIVVYLRRHGGQNQFSNLLVQQEKAGDEFGDLLFWISNNLCGDLSNQALADRVNVCVRHFSRKFKEVFGDSPGKVIESIRIEIAKEKILSGEKSMSRLAYNTGFNSTDIFTRSFKRVTGITPTQFRDRFR